MWCCCAGIPDVGVGVMFRALVCVLYHFTSICILLSWCAQVMLHQLLCDMGLWGYHGRHVVGVVIGNLPSLFANLTIRGYPINCSGKPQTAGHQDSYYCHNWLILGGDQVWQHLIVC